MSSWLSYRNSWKDEPSRSGEYAEEELVHLSNSGQPLGIGSENACNGLVLLLSPGVS
jgi:hypothetical protein